MRRSLSTVFVLLSSGLIAMSLAGTASASALPTLRPCRAYSDVPHLQVGGGTRLTSKGTFSCDEPASGMTVKVCIEENSSPTDGTWWSRGCTTLKQIEDTDEIIANVFVSVPVYATYLRTHVEGFNDNDLDPAHKVIWNSPPVWWFNCACYIG